MQSVAKHLASSRQGCESNEASELLRYALHDDPKS